MFSTLNVCARRYRGAMASFVAVFLITSAWTEVVSAQSQTFFYTGTVTEVPTELNSRFSIGDVISGSYTFNTNATSSVAGDGSKSYGTAVSDFTMDVDGYTLSQRFGPGSISIGNNIENGIDTHWVVSLSEGARIDGFAPQLHGFQLEDSTGQIFSSDALPTTPFDVSGFDNPLITIDFGDGTSLARVEGQLTSLAVPEPSGVLLMSFSALLLAPRRRRS